MIIYGIPGLGADQRVFEGLHLPVNPIIWVEPDKEDTVKSYAEKLLPQIATNKPFAIIGVSFGGMVATELSKLLKPELTILISSAACKEELPAVIKLIPSFINWMPESLLVKHNPVVNWLFGVKSNYGRTMLKQIIADTDVHFLKWALKAISQWDNKWLPDNLMRIHGAADKLIPLQEHRVDYSIKAGGHFMIVEQGELIGKILRKEIKRVSNA